MTRTPNLVKICQVPNFVLVAVGFLIHSQSVAATCKPCVKKLNNVCCERPEKIWRDDPGKKICCDFSRKNSTESVLTNSVYEHIQCESHLAQIKQCPARGKFEEITGIARILLGSTQCMLGVNYGATPDKLKVWVSGGCKAVITVSLNICHPNPCKHGGTCKKKSFATTSPFKCTCPTGFKGERCQKVPEDACQSPIIGDIGFALDVSGSVKYDWEKEKKFTKTIAKTLNISESGNHVSVLTFDQSAYLNIKFSDFKKYDKFAAEVDKLLFTDGGTNISNALNYALVRMFQPYNGMRSGTESKWMILITDGGSGDIWWNVNGDGFINLKKAFQRKNIRLVVVGVGNVIRGNLRKLVSRDTDLFIANDFDDLNKRLTQDIADNICSAKYVLKPKNQVCASSEMIANLEECKFASNQLTLNFIETESVEDFPKGCYKHTGSSDSYWNIHISGSASAHANAICNSNCVDKTNGLTDKYQQGCDWYEHYPHACGIYDVINGFTANTMCCACKA